MNSCHEEGVRDRNRAGIEATDPTLRAGCVHFLMNSYREEGVPRSIPVSKLPIPRFPSHGKVFRRSWVDDGCEARGRHIGKTKGKGHLEARDRQLRFQLDSVRFAQGGGSPEVYMSSYVDIKNKAKILSEVEVRPSEPLLLPLLRLLPLLGVRLLTDTRLLWLDSLIRIQRQQYKN
eukprot:gene13767-biopygen3731